jgi:hypothetical protein
MLKRAKGLLSVLLLTFAVLLTCLALFFANELWRSLESPHTPAYERSTSGSNQKTEKNNPFNEVWEWATHDAITVYTGILAIFTGVLSVVSIIQIRYLIRADYLARRSLIAGRQAAIVAKKAADAALLNAQAAAATERAYISGGGGAEPNGTTFRFDINNYGKTPGNLIEIRWGFISLNDPIPSAPPSYDAPYFRYDWIKPYTWIGGIHKIDVPANIAKPAIYGRYYYRDVFNKSRSSGFILSILPDGQTKPIRAPAIYSREQDEDDPDENLSYRV